MATVGIKGLNLFRHINPQNNQPLHYTVRCFNEWSIERIKYGINSTLSVKRWTVLNVRYNIASHTHRWLDLPRVS